MRLVKWRRIPVVGRGVHAVLNLYGLEIPNSVDIGEGSRIIHHGFGTVIHPEVRIGCNVTIFHNVTLGRADAVVVPRERSAFGGMVIDDGAVICAGATVIGGAGQTRVGRHTIVAAGAVLTQSTGDNEVWGGVPARKLADRTVED